MKCSERNNQSLFRDWSKGDPIVGSQLVFSDRKILPCNSRRNTSSLRIPVTSRVRNDRICDVSTLTSAHATTTSHQQNHQKTPRSSGMLLSHQVLCNSEVPTNDESSQVEVSGSFDNVSMIDESLGDNNGTDAAGSSMNLVRTTDTTTSPDEVNVHLVPGTFHISEDDERFKVIASKRNLANLRILDVFQRSHVPFSMYDEIINTIFEEIRTGNIDPYEFHFSRESFLAYIKKRFKTAEPNITPVRLENRWNTNNNAGEIRPCDLVEVITFDVKEQLEDLFADKTLFGDLDNLVVNKDPDNPDSRWLPYVPQDGRLYEVLDAKWYQDYGKHCVTDESKQFCCPIGLYIDESETVTYGRYSFQPLIMFPLILTVKARNRNTSSRVIALIPDLEAKSSAVKAYSRAGEKLNTGTSMRNFHQCMAVALHSLKTYQNEGGIITYLQLGNQIRNVQVKIPVGCILGDAKSQDTLCGRFLSWTTKRLCRACNVSFESCNRAGFKCKWNMANKYAARIIVALNTDGIFTKQEQKKALASLHRRSVHSVVNAFEGIDFGGCPRGIYGCTPHDLMHLFLEGVLKYSTRLFVNRYTIKQKAEIDMLVMKMFNQFRSSERQNLLPRVSFNKGMTNLTMITADEEVGMAVTLLILGHTKKGQEIYETQLEENTTVIQEDEETQDEDGDDSEVGERVEDFERVRNPTNDRARRDADDVSILTRESFQSVITQEESGRNVTYRSVLQVMEMMLSFHAWYKSKKPMTWTETSYEALLTSIRTMIREIKTVIPRTEGNGWNLQKFHELLHIPVDVMNFGSPKNFDTGIYENRLIYVGKKNAKFCQKRGHTVFTQQLAGRIHENQCIEKGKRLLLRPDQHKQRSDGDSDDESCISSLSSLNIDGNGGRNAVQPDRGTDRMFPSYLVVLDNEGRAAECRWLTQTKCTVPIPIIRRFRQYLTQNNARYIAAYTEIKWMGRIFRAHPNFQKRGAWYDWAIIQEQPNQAERRRHQYNVRNHVNSACKLGQRPVKMLAFFVAGDDKCFLYHRTEDKSDSVDDSALAEQWSLKYTDSGNFSFPAISIASVNSIVDSVFCIEEDPQKGLISDPQTSKRVVLLKKKKCGQRNSPKQRQDVIELSLHLQVVDFVHVVIVSTQLLCFHVERCHEDVLVSVVFCSLAQTVIMEGVEY